MCRPSPIISTCRKRLQHSWSDPVRAEGLGPSRCGGLFHLGSASSLCHLGWLHLTPKHPGPSDPGSGGQMLDRIVDDALPADVPVSGPVFTYSRPEQSFLRRSLIRVVERLSGRARFERLYKRWQAEHHNPAETIFATGIRALGVSADLDAGALEQMPETGGVLVVANHPFGIVDGLLVAAMAATRRRDVRLMVHSLLCQPPEAREALLPVDFAETAEARRCSAETRRRAVEWLDQGHVLVLFPAGSVSTVPAPMDRHAVDCAWHPFVTRLATRPGVRTVPVFVHGQNSRLFQWASHYSYPLRVALIFAETRARIGRKVKVSIGAPVVATDLGDNAGAAARLQALCYGMAGPGGPAADKVFVWPKRIRF